MGVTLGEHREWDSSQGQETVEKRDTMAFVQILGGQFDDMDAKTVLGGNGKFLAVFVKSKPRYGDV